MSWLISRFWCRRIARKREHELWWVGACLRYFWCRQGGHVLADAARCALVGLGALVSSSLPATCSIGHSSDPERHQKPGRDPDCGTAQETLRRADCDMPRMSSVSRAISLDSGVWRRGSSQRMCSLLDQLEQLGCGTPVCRRLQEARNPGSCPRTGSVDTADGSWRWDRLTGSARRPGGGLDLVRFGHEHRWGRQPPRCRPVAPPPRTPAQHWARAALATAAMR